MEIVYRLLLFSFFPLSPSLLKYSSRFWHSGNAARKTRIYAQFILFERGETRPQRPCLPRVHDGNFSSYESCLSSDKRGHRGEKLGGALPFKSRWIFAWQTATLPAARREIEACFLIRTINSWQGSASLGRCQYEIRTRRRRGQTPTKHTQRKASI